MKKFFQSWGPVLAYAFLIYIQSSFPRPVAIPFPYDKIIHFFEFALLGFFVGRALLLNWNISQWAVVIIAGGLAGLWGILDELHQAFVPERMASLGDGIADFLGAYFGAIGYLLLGKLLYRKKALYPAAPCEFTGNCPGSGG